MIRQPEESRSIGSQLTVLHSEVILDPKLMHPLLIPFQSLPLSSFSSHSAHSNLDIPRKIHVSPGPFRNRSDRFVDYPTESGRSGVPKMWDAMLCASKSSSAGYNGGCVCFSLGFTTRCLVHRHRGGERSGVGDTDSHCLACW